VPVRQRALPLTFTAAFSDKVWRRAVGDYLFFKRSKNLEQISSS
jgi:hypothetical protein